MRAAAPAERTAVIACAAAVALVLAAQVPLALGLLSPGPRFDAAHATTVLAVNAALAIATVAAAALLPARLRALALVPGGLTAATLLGGALTLGGHAWDLAAAGLTFAGAWWIGRALLRLLHADLLRDVFAIELAIGLGVVGLVVLTLGRLDAIAWWSAGLALVATGAIGLWRGVAEGWGRRGAVWEAVAETRVGAACAGLLLLQLGWAAVWLSAPEIMFDPVFSKAYLPDLWAYTGSIGPLLAHPQLNVMGLAQVVATPGHTLDAGDVGRELQLLAWVALVATVWWWAGRRSAAGAFAALAVGLAPQLVWQATTAFDDLVLALGAVALALAVFRTVGDRAAGDAPADASFGLAVAIGLLAGSCAWLKLHLLVVSFALVAGWLLAAGPARHLVRRVAGVALGALVVGGPSFALRWIDTGNPVFPTYNSIFKSPHYPPIDEPYNFPFWPDAGLWELVKLPYEAIVHPFLMSEAAPEGAYGLLVAATVVGALLGWRQRPRRAALVVWAALVVGLVAWWIQFRYLRYALPLALVAVLLVVAQLRDWRPGRLATGALLAAAALASVAFLPSTVASFWNVPNRELPFAAAYGRWDGDDYLRTVFPEKDALEAYRRIAPPGADAFSDAYARLFARDRGLSPPWEVYRLLELSGPPPTAAGDALRRLRDLGIGWAVVTGANRTADGLLWLPALLAAHGEPVFADRGWDVYRLAEQPARPRRLPACDTRLLGRPHCWDGGFDARPGLSAEEGVAARVVPSCPGQVVGVRLTTAPGGQAAQVTLNSGPPGTMAGHTSGTVPPGRTGWVYGTAAAGSLGTNVAISAGLDGGRVVRADVGLLGRCPADG